MITDLKTGGVPLHLARVVPRVQAAGFEPVVISLGPMGEVGEELERRGVRCVACDAVGAWDLRAVAKLVWYLRRFRPEVVHSFLFHANVASRFAVLLAGVSSRRLICEIQTVEIERRWHLTVGGMTHRLGRLVVGNSPSVVEHLHRRAHIPRSRLHCVAGGIDVEALENGADVDLSVHGISTDEPVVMWVGRLDPVKGLDELVRAFARVVRERKAQLVLIGDGPLRSHVEGVIARHGVGDCVFLLGRQSNVGGFVRRCDVFAFPSYTEGMPNALLEAMALGRAIVATEVAGCRDVVSHGVSGLLVPSRDEVALADGIERLLDDRELGLRMGVAAREHCLAHFTMDRCVARYVDLYREVEGTTC